MIEFLFLDLDDTILDFHKAEKLAIRKTIESFGAEVTDGKIMLVSSGAGNRIHLDAQFPE